jgi:signal transduction histidine kinase
LALNPRNSRLIEAIGGPWLGYIPAYAALVPLWFVASLLSTPLTQGWAQLGLTFIANLGALAACAGLFFVFKVTLWRPRHGRPVALWVVILSGLLFGLTKVLMTAALTSLLFQEDVQDIWGRLISSSVIGIAVVIVVPVMFSQLELYRAEREQLIAELVRRDLAQPTTSRDAVTQEVGQTSRRIRKAPDSLEEFVTRSRQRLNLARIKPSLLPQILEEIREKDARALSHQIWQRENERIPDFTVTNLITLSLRRLNFVIAPVILAFVFVAGPVELFTYGIQLGTTALVVQCVVIITVLGLARRLPQRGVRWGLWVFVAAILLMTAAIAIITPLIAEPLTPAQNLQQGISILLLLSSAVFASSVVNMAQRNIKQVHEDITALAPDLKNQALNKAQSTRMNLELAQLLHSHVQNVLLSRSMQLQEELHSHNLSTEERDHILRTSLEELDNYLDNLSSGHLPPTAGVHTIEQICTAWAGVITLLVDADLDHLDTHKDLSPIISSVIAEAIANAVKHGLAKNAQLTISCVGSPHCSELLLSVEDDGIGVRQGKPGLGSMYLNSIPHSTWSLSPSLARGGSALTVQFQLIPSPANIPSTSEL